MSQIKNKTNMFLIFFKKLYNNNKIDDIRVFVEGVDGGNFETSYG